MSRNTDLYVNNISLLMHLHYVPHYQSMVQASYLFLKKYIKMNVLSIIERTAGQRLAAANPPLLISLYRPNII